MKQKITKLKNSKVLRVLFAMVVALLVVGGYIFYQKSSDRVSIENSLISAPIITINAPATGGKIVEMDAVEGQQIKKGDTLAVVGTDTLYADTDGVVISAANQTGSTTSSQTQLIQLINPNDMRVAGTLDENKGLNNVHVGQVVSFTIDAFPGKTYWGYVDEISPSAKQTQLAYSISSERPTQQFVVYSRFDAAKYPEIKNSMSAKMVVYTKTN